MKWSKVIETIEHELSKENRVEITYHRKWMPQISNHDTVDGVVDYKYDGKVYKAINTYHDQLLETLHIVDEIIVK